jgi:hypothetical protein
VVIKNDVEGRLFREKVITGSRRLPGNTGRRYLRVTAGRGAYPSIIDNPDELAKIEAIIHAFERDYPEKTE